MHAITATAFALLAVSAVAPLANAQEFPAKPVRFLVPFPPAGAVDILGRALATPMSKSLGQNVIVENRPGGNTVIGAELVVRAPADGHTVLLMAPSFTINQFVRSKLPYDTVKDFTGVTLIASGALLIAVHPSLPAKNTKELIALAKANPGKLAYGSAGSGSLPHLAMESFKAATGTDIVHVPYKGGGPMVTDLLGGTVHVVIADQANLMPHVKAGKLRALAVASPKRSPNAPELPTLGDTLPGFQAVAWNGMVGPPGLPPDIVAKLNGAVVKVMALPEVRERLAGGGLDVVGDSPDEFGRFIRAEIAKWSAIAKQVGAKAD